MAHTNINIPKRSYVDEVTTATMNGETVTLQDIANTVESLSTGGGGDMSNYQLASTAAQTGKVLIGGTTPGTFDSVGISSFPPIPGDQSLVTADSYSQMVTVVSSIVDMLDDGILPESDPIFEAWKNTITDSQTGRIKPEYLPTGIETPAYILSSAPSSPEQNAIYIFPNTDGQYQSQFWDGTNWNIIGDFTSVTDLSDYVRKEDLSDIAIAVDLEPIENSTNAISSGFAYNMAATISDNDNYLQSEINDLKMNISGLVSNQQMVDVISQLTDSLNTQAAELSDGEKESVISELQDYLATNPNPSVEELQDEINNILLSLGDSLTTEQVQQIVDASLVGITDANYVTPDEMTAAISAALTGQSVDLSGYYTKPETDALINGITADKLGLSKAMELKGTSTTNAILAMSGAQPGDTWIASETTPQQMYVWTTSGWANIGSTDVDLDNYYTKDQINSLLQSSGNSSGQTVYKEFTADNDPLDIVTDRFIVRFVQLGGLSAGTMQVGSNTDAAFTMYAGDFHMYGHSGSAETALSEEFNRTLSFNGAGTFINIDTLVGYSDRGSIFCLLNDGTNQYLWTICTVAGTLYDAQYCTMSLTPLGKLAGGGGSLPELDHEVINTQYQTQVDTPIDIETGDQLVTAAELSAHSAHDLNAIQGAMDAMNLQVANLQSQILDIKSGISNKTITGQTAVDIKNTTYTVSNPLGARLQGQGVRTVNLLGITVLSTGDVSVQGTQVYDNSSLLAVGPAEILSMDVNDGDVITSNGMSYLNITNYVAG